MILKNEFDAAPRDIKVLITSHCFRNRNFGHLLIGIHGCFINLRIVGPAWMNHLTNCPVYHFASVTDCPPFFKLFDHWFVVLGRWVHGKLSDHQGALAKLSVGLNF